MEDRNGNLWFGTVGGAIRLDGERLTTFTTEDGLAHNTVSSILEDSEGNLWFATNGGVSRYDGTWTIYTTEDGLADNVVLTILEDREGNLWFGTSEGVNRYDGERWTTFTTEDGLAGNWVAVIFEDREGNLWFGTVFGGVSRYDGERWTNYTTEDGLANNWVRSIFEDSEGDLWFGTIRVIISEVDVTVEGGGVSRYDGEMWTTYTTEDGLANDWVDLIFEDTEGNMWFGTENEGGVSRYDGERWKTYTTEDGLAGNQVYTIFEDSDGNLWLGTVFRGVSRYDGTWTTYTTEDGLAHNWVEAILEDTEGNLWFGTFEGVSRYDGERWTTYTTADGLAHNWVLTIFEDSEGNLWFGTYAGGVSRYDGEKWTTYTTEDGLAHNWVEAILEDREGNMWFLNGGFVGRGITRYRGDRIPPNTFIFDGPEGTIGIPQAFFQYSGGDRYSPEADVQYAYVIDPSEADWSDFTDLTSLLTDPFPHGTYTFYVRAIDKAGNIDLTPAKRTFTVDLTPPTVLISSPSNNEIIQGEVSIEGSAFDNSDIPDFGSYTLEYGSGSDEDKISEWRSVRDRTTKPVVNDLLGVWDTEGLFGTYVLRLRAVDGFDHRSKYAITVQVDNIPPTAQITSPSPNTTYSGTLSIHGTVEDENLRGYTLQYARTSQDTVWKDIKSDTTSGIEEGLLASWDSSNETGKITLRLEATDFAGNVSTPSDVILNLDNSGALPQSQITFPSPGEVVSGLVTIRGESH